MINLKYNLQWIIKHKGTFDFEEEITFPTEMFESYNQINGLKDVKVSGTGNLDTRDKRLYVDLNIKGTMILPCALTLEDVDYPFDIDSTEVFTFENGVATSTEVDLNSMYRCQLLSSGRFAFVQL